MNTTCRCLFAAALALSAGTLFGDDDYDIRLNGDFRGSSVNASTVPGWTADAFTATRSGGIRIVQGEDWDEFELEITAAGKESVNVCSDLHPVIGNTLKLETEAWGKGTGSIGFLAFDANRQAIAGGVSQPFTATGFRSKVKIYFPIPAEVKFVKIQLSADPASQILFGDVDAEFKHVLNPIAMPPPVRPAPVANMSVAQAPVQTAPQTIPAVQCVPSVPAQTVAPAVQTLSLAQAVTAAPYLIHDKLYTLSSILPNAGNVFQATVPVRGEIDFNLEEDAAKGIYWTIQSYDPTICRVKVDHDRDGIWPFRYDKSEIELKGLIPGQTMVVFTCPPNRTFTVILTVR